MPAVIQIFIAVVIISAVVGAVAQFLSKMAAQQNKSASARRPEADRSSAAVRQSNTDMDRFLAEIDRLRQRNEPPAASPATRPAQRVARRAAEPVRPPSRPQAVSESSPSFMPTMPTRAEELPQVSQLPQVSMLPQMSVQPLSAPNPVPSFAAAPPPIVGAPVTPVTPRAVVGRRRAAPQTEFAAQLTALLGTKGGLPLAIVLTEILGKPKSRPM